MPIGYLHKKLKDVFEYCFTWKNPVSKMTPFIKRFFTFSMPMYLSLVNAVVYILFEEWYRYMLVNQVFILRFQEGELNQCNGTKVSIEAINQTLINVRNYMTYGSYLESGNMRLFVFVTSLGLFAFHVLESVTNFNKVSVNFLSFFSGYKAVECRESVDVSPEQIPLQDFEIELNELIHQRQETRFLHQTPTPTESQSNIVTNVTQIILSFLGLSLILFIVCIPNLFYLYRIETDMSGKLISFSEFDLSD